MCFDNSADIVNADVVMKRLHLNLRGSCSIGFCHFSMPQSCSLKCCLLTEKCLFSQREETIMHLVFYMANKSLIFYRVSNKFTIICNQALPLNIYLYDFIPNRIGKLYCIFLQ